MSTRILTPACALLGALALAAPAAAKLPSPSSTTIDPGVSVGGVKLGQGVKKAKQAWGGGKCDGSDARNGSCQFLGTPKQGSASFGYVDGKVVDMQINLGQNSKGVTVLRSPLAALKTSKGVGLGSTKKAVKQAYPKGKDYTSVWSVPGKGKAYTTFSFNEGGKVTTLIVGDGKHQG